MDPATELDPVSALMCISSERWGHDPAQFAAQFAAPDPTPTFLG